MLGRSGRDDLASEDELFDPAQYEKVRLPYLAAQTLPPRCYTAPAFFEREIERLFRRHWNLIGRAEQIADSGDYFTVDLAGVPIIVLRDDDGGLRALANTCRHRGSRLVSGAGNCRALTCPYHGWSYGLDGSLLAMAGMERTKDFERAEFALVPVRLAVWAGFVFVSFAADGPGLAEHLGNLVDHLGSHDGAAMVCTHVREYELACNWKLCVENQRESYHVATVHRASLKDQLPGQLDATGHWSGSYFRHEETIAARLGAPATLPRIATLEGPAAQGTYFIALYPGAFLVFTVDCMWWMSFRPLAPDRTKLVVGSCFAEAQTRAPGFDAIARDYYARTGQSHAEDNAATEYQQRGLASPHARPGRLGHREAGVHAFDNWILDQVLGPVPEPG